MTRSPSRLQKVVAAAAASAIAVGGTALLLGAGTGAASSHREAPQITNDPTADNTDVYAFVSPDAPDTVTLVANWYPNQTPDGGPNFYPWATGDQARYTIKIDSDGDAVEDTTYLWEFETQDLRGAGTGTILYNNGPVTSLTDENLLFRQTYTLTEIKEGVSTVLLTDAPVAPSHVGTASMPDYGALRAEATVDVPGGGMSYAGQADDPFFLDLRVFDLLYGADLSERGIDTLSGVNVNSVALQVPITDVASATDPVIGVWSTTERRSIRTQLPDGTQTYTGNFVQISRLGNPLVNEVVFPASLKDAFNALAPASDADVPQAVDKVLNPEVPILLNAIYDLPIPPTPRDDLFTIYLTGLEGLNKPAGAGRPSEMLRLNTDIPPSDDPSALGVLGGDTAGFPNGRRLADDIIDISLQAVAGAVTVDARGGAATGVEIVEALADGDQVDENDKLFGDTFPYLALPFAGVQNAAAVARDIDDSCPADVITEDGFTDVPASSPFESAVDCVAYWDIANGTSTTMYSPADSVTRGQMAAFIARLVTETGGTLAPASRDFFSDDNGSSFEAQINLLAQAGIVKGTASRTFGPDSVVTRAQMAAFLVRAYDFRATAGGEAALVVGDNFFPDDEGLGLETDINKAAAAGFTGGNTDGTYRPANPVRRDHMAAFLSRVLDLIVENGLGAVPGT